MTLEDTLRHSLHDEAGGAASSPDAWADVCARAAARRRRRQTVGYPLAGLSTAAAVVVVAVGLATLRDGAGERGNVIAGPPDARPEQIAAVVDGRVVVLDSEDGRVVRVLADGPDADGASSVEVGADGQTVYFTRAVADPACEQDAVPEIVRVPVGGGTLEVVTRGHHPVLSPDGRSIAYATAATPCGPPGLLVVGAVDSEPSRQVDEGDSFVVPLDWSPDSGRVLYESHPLGEGDGATREVEAEAVGDAPPRTISVPPRWGQSTYLGGGAEIAGAVVESDRSRVVVASLVSGATRELFALAEVPVFGIDADASGRHVLTVALAPLPDAPPILYRWSEGGEPVRLLEGVEEAAWVPGTTAPTFAPPSRVVAATDDGRVVVLETATGEEVREVASGVEIGFGPPRITVSPDGQTVYVPHFTTQECPTDQPGTTLRFARFATAGGKPEVIEGDYPTPSSDGRLLAYVRDGFSDTCGLSNELVVQDLASGTVTTWLVDAADAAVVAGTLSWSSDSRHLFLGVYGEETFSYHVLDTQDGAVSPIEAPIVPVPQELVPSGYLGDTGLLLAVETPEAEPVRLVAVDPATGKAARMLLTVDEKLVMQEEISSDRSGRHLLFAASDVTEIREIDGGTQVFRWTEAEGVAQLGDGLVFAAWLPELPGPAEPPADAAPEPQITPMPDTIVAATQDGRLVELAAADGEVGGTSVTGAVIEHLALAPGGSVLYETPRRECGDSLYNGQVLRVERGPGAVPEPVTMTGDWPAVSPDGRRLAYVTTPTCAGPAALAVRDVGTGAERVLPLAPPTDGGPEPELVGPLTWDADSRHLLVRVNLEPATELWYVDADAPGDVLDGRRIPPRGEQGGPFAVEFLGATGRLAAAVADPDDESRRRIVELDLATGREHRVLVDLNGRGSLQWLASDASGDHLLFVVDGTLYRFSPGDDEPRKVAEKIVVADW